MMGHVAGNSQIGPTALRFGSFKDQAFKQDQVAARLPPTPITPPPSAVSTCDTPVHHVTCWRPRRAHL